VRTALRIATHHFHVHNPGAAVHIIEDGLFITFRYTILQENMQGREQVLDEAMAVEFNVMRALCGDNWLPKEVHFAHAPPPDLVPFGKFFRAALRFEQDETALVFDRHWLDAVPPGADPLLNRMMAQRVSELELFFGEDLVGQVRQMLSPLVAARSGSLDDVARRVGLGPRTLIRRLAAEGTSFKQLHEEARYRIACQLLESTSMLASEIAERIGYANASSLTRAFLRWTGSGPAEWRESRRKRASGRSTNSDRPWAARAGSARRSK
jgi:AraC-like DNA-binding protein